MYIYADYIFPANISAPKIKNNEAAENLIYSGRINFDKIPPKKTVMRVTTLKAATEAKKTLSHDFALAAKQRLAICVLSHNSAKNIAQKVAKNIFQSIEASVLFFLI